MKEIYLIIEQGFFISNGIDYAMAVDAVNDIDIYKDYEKALSFFEDKAEEICRNTNIEMNIISNNCFERVVEWKRPNGNRHYLKMIKKKVR